MRSNFDGFRGLRVLSLESRRQREIAHLVANHGGDPMVAASLRKVPSGPNSSAKAFLAELFESRLEAMVFMTGVGTRALAQALQTTCPVEKLVAAPSRLKVVARSHKPAGALRSERGRRAFYFLPW